jgi:hypothetical protein
MKNPRRENIRIIGLAPSARGLGFAVLDGETLVDWGLRSVEGNKNAHSLIMAQKLIAGYQPDKIIIEDYWAERSRRAPRIRELGEQLFALAEGRKIKVKALSRKHIFREFLGVDQGTKQAVAEALAIRFREELGSRLPPKRRAWMSEDSRMDIFVAVALAVMGL